MAQGPPLLPFAVSPVAVTPPHGRPCPSAPTCRGFTSCHSTDATNTNATPPEPYQREAPRGFGALLRPVRDGVPSQADGVGERFPCGSVPPAQTHVGSRSPPDVCHQNTGSSVPKIIVAATIAAGTEAGGRLDALAVAAEASAHEPTDQHVLGDKRQRDATSPAGSTGTTSAQRGETQPIKVVTQCVYTAAAVEPAVRVSDTSPTGTPLFSARNRLGYSPQCTVFRAETSTGSGVTPSVAAVATSKCAAAKLTATIEVRKPAGAVACTGNKSAAAVDVTAALCTDRGPTANAAAKTATAEPKRSEAVAADLSGVDAAAAGATVAAGLEPASHGTGAPTVAAVAAPIIAASKCAAAGTAADTAHQAAPVQRDGEGCWWHSSASRHLRKGKSHSFCHRVDSAETSNRSSCRNAKHEEESGDAIRVNDNSAECSSCPTIKMRGTTVGQGDTTDTSTSHANVERPRLRRTVEDPRTLPESSAHPDKPSSISLSSCGGEGLPHSKQKSSERSQDGINSNELCSNGNGKGDFCHENSVNGSTDRLITDNCEPISSYHCNSSVDGSSKCNTYGGNITVGNSIFPFTSLVDSSRSTTVSTPSPAASSTPRSVRSCSLQMDRVYCLISSCDNCDVCDVRSSSSDSGTTGEGTGPIENDTSLLEWYEVSQAALLGCSCCCTPSPPLGCSTGVLAGEEAAASCCVPICRFNGDRRALGSRGVPRTRETAIPDTPTRRATAVDAAHEEEHQRVYVTDNDVQLHPKPLPVEELLLPAAVVLSRDVLLRAQQQRQLPRSPPILQAPHPIDNALGQADAAVTPAAAACRKGNGVWCCSSSSWSSPSSSTCSPSVFSQLPIVPLSVWPVPATYMGEDGVLRPQTAMKSTSRDNGECNNCSRGAKLICCGCSSGDCRSQEIVVHPAGHENHRKDSLNSSRHIVQGNCRPHLGRRRHKQSLASVSSDATSQSPSELVLPALFERPAHLDRDAIQVKSEASAAAGEDVITVPVDADDASASNQMEILPASRSPSLLQLPLLFPAECWVMSQVARGAGAVAPSASMRDASRADAAFYCSTLRTATLLLGDHDSETTTTGDWGVCNSSSFLAQQYREETYQRNSCTTGDSGRNNAHCRPGNSCGSTVGVKESCNSFSSSGRAGLSQSCALQGKEQQGSLQKEQAPSRPASTAELNNLPSRQCCTNDHMPGPQSKDWLPARGEPQRQQGSKQRAATQEQAGTDGLQLQEADHRYGQQVRQAGDAGRADAVQSIENTQADTSVEGASVTAALDERRAHGSETTIGMTPLRHVTAIKDTSAAAEQRTRAEPCKVNQGLQPGKAEPFETAATAADSLVSLQKTLRVESNRPLPKKVHDLIQCDSDLLDSIHMQKAAGTVTETPGSTVAAPDAIAAVWSDAVAAGGRPFEASTVLHAARPKSGDGDTNSSLADSSMLNGASFCSNEAPRADATTGIRQERRAAAVSGTVEEHLQLLQDCVVAPADTRVPATPPAPRRHRRNKPEDVYTSSETRHRSTAQAESRRWSRSSSRGSVSSTSTQSGLPSHWTSRSSSTRCSPLSSSKDEPLASAVTAADGVEQTPAAADHCLSAADLLPPIPACTRISLPHTGLHQVMSTSNPQRSSPHKSFEPVSVATACDAAVGGSSVPKNGRVVEFAECPGETTCVAAVTSMLHPERVPPTILAAARHAAAAPPVSAGPAVVGSLALDGFLPAKSSEKLAASPAVLDSLDAAAVSENHIALQPVQPLDWPSTLLGTGGAPPRAPGTGVNSSITPGPPVRGTTFGPSLATKAFTKTSRSPNAVAAVAFSGLGEAASVWGRCASHSADLAALDPASVLPCDTAASEQHSIAAPFLLVADAQPESGEKNSSPAAVMATQIPCLSSSSANAGTLLNTRIEGDRAEVVEHPCVKEGKAQVLRQTSWFGQHTFKKEHCETQESRHAAAELATLSTTQPSRSDAHINHQDPVQFESRHLQPALKELPTHQRVGRGIRGQQPVQQLRQHQLQRQETEKPSQLHEHHHPCCLQGPQEVVTHVEGVYHRRSSNTPLAPADYPPPRTESPVGQKASTEGLRHQGSSGVNDNISNNPKSRGTLNPVVAVKALPPAAADAAFFSCNTPNCADAVRCSSAWVSATGATVASSAGEGDTAVVTGNGGNWDSRFVEDTNCTLNGGYEASDTSACRTFHTSAVDVAAASLSSSATPAATPAGSAQGMSCWKPPQQHVCSAECMCAGSSGGFVIDTTVLTDGTLLPGPLLERGGEEQIPQQLQHGVLASTCPSRIRQTTASARAPQDFRAESRLGSIQTPETATATSREWVPVTAHTQREPPLQQAAARKIEAPAKTGGEQYTEEAESHRQTGHRRWVTQQQTGVPDPGAGLYSETAAAGKPLLKRKITASTTVQVAEDGDISSDAARGCASGQDASFTRPRYTSAVDTPVFHGAAAAARLPASTSAVSPAAAHTGTGDTKAAADAEMYPAAEDRRDGQEEPEREHLITMSDSRWIALRRSGLFRLGDKGRASIKSRIAKQLRLCPDLRRAAAAIGGGGVRCATTKQLYQLAELCGFDDVLPPEFRRPRSSTVQSGATPVADTPAPVTHKTDARFVVAGDARKCRAEKTSSISSAVPLVSTKSPAPGEASAEDRSSASSTAVPTGASSGVDNGDLRARYDSNSSSGRPFDSSSLSTTAYKADTVTLQNLSRQQPASALEQQLQQKLTAHCVSEKRSHKVRQQAQRHPSAAATMTQVTELQHNSAVWRPSKMQQLQRQRSHNAQQAPLQHVYQHQQQQSVHQYQQQLHHQQQSHTFIEPKQQRCYEQQHQLPLQHEREPAQKLLSMFPHAPRETTKFCEPCGSRAAIKNAVPEPLTDQQSPPVQMRSRQREPVEEHHMQQRQEPQVHLLQQDSIRSHHEPALQQLHFQEQQQTAQHHQEQERILGGHLHTKANAAVLDALKATPSRIEATGIETAQASRNHARSTEEFLGASKAHSTTVVAISPHAAVFTLSPASGSTADNRYSTSRNDNNCDGCCNNNTNDDSWTQKRSTMNSACWTPGTNSSELFNCDSVAPPKQLCMLQQMPRRNGDKQLQHDQQQLPQNRPFCCAGTTAGEWISLEGVPTGVPSNAAASPEKGSASVTNSKASAEVVAGASSGIAVGGPAAGVVTDGRGQGLQQGVSPLITVAPAETAPAGVAQSHLTQKGSTLPQEQPLAVLSQSAQGSRTASTSSQSWAENGVGSSLISGSSLTASGRDCLAEYAGAKTPAREEIPRRTASSNNAGDAAHCEREGGAAPLRVDATVAVAAATVAAKCRPSPAAGEQASCNGDAQVRATQEQRPSHARPPKKRRRVESRGTASQQRSSPRAFTSNNEKQHPPQSQCFLDEHDVAQQRQQLSDGSGATYPGECCQPPTALLHGSQGEQLRKKVMAPVVQDIRIGEPQQRLELAAEVEERVHQQHAQQRQDTWQHPWKDGSLRLPGCVSQLLCNVEASRYALAMNEELQSPDSKTANGLEAYHQLEEVCGTGPQHFSSVSDSQGQQAHGTSARSWQEELCSSTSNTRCTTTLCSHNSSIASSTWMSAADTHVVDEFFDAQPTPETGSSSGRFQVHQDTNCLMKGCDRSSS